jgi:hypothetical protein
MAGTQTLSKGDPRGPSAAVVGYDDFNWKAGERSLEIFFWQPVERLRYAEGADLADERRAEIARERSPALSCPAYLLDDDAKAEQAARAIIAGGDGSTAGAARQQEWARKNRRKAARAVASQIPFPGERKAEPGAGSSGFHVADELVFQSVP